MSILNLKNNDLLSGSSMYITNLALNRLISFHAINTGSGLIFWVAMLLLLGAATTNTYAQSFSVSPTKVNIQADETFKITYTLKNGEMRNFSPPDFKDFYVLSGPNQSQQSSMSFGNGGIKRESTISQTYILRPKKAGNFVIAPAEVTTNKKKKLQSVAVKVAVNSSGKSVTSKTPSSTPSNAQVDKNSPYQVWVEAIADTSSVYQGQQLTITYRLYTNTQITNYNITAPPSFTGFWVEDISPQYRQTPNQVAIDDQLYSTYDLRKYALFPQRSGTLDIDVMEVEVTLRIPAPNSGNSFFQRYYSQNTKIVSKPIAVSVYDLPTEGKPSNFTGAVGKFNVSTTVSNPNLRANESLDFAINLTGTGNIKLIELPTLSFPDSFDSFDPEISSDVYTKQDLVTGRKSFNYTIIPTKEGQYTIPPIVFPYFNSETQQYETAVTAKIDINVTAGADIATDNIKQAQASEDKNDIYPILKAGRLGKAGAFFYGSIPFWLLLIFPIVVLPVALYRIKQQQTALLDVEGIKRRQATKVALQRLEAAQQFAKSKDKKAFYNEVIRAIWDYLGDKIGIPQSELSKNNIKQQLTMLGVADSLSTQLIDTITYCEMALFAPVADADNLDGTYNNALALIGEIETVVNQKP